MKKQLLSTFILVGTVFGLNAQVLQSDNFNGHLAGNVGTVTNGSVAGQGGWLTAIVPTGSDNTNNENFQFVVGDASNKYFRMTASSTAAGTRFMWKEGLVAAWVNRTIGNEIIEVEFDYFTGESTVSKNEFRVYVLSDEAVPKILAGIGIAKNLVVSGTNFSNVVRGFLYWTSTSGTGTYSIGLGQSANVPHTLPQESWVKLSFSFNKTSGQVIWKSSLGLESSFSGSEAFPMVTAGMNPGQVDFRGNAGTGNTVASSADFDNFVVRAIEIDPLSISENEFATVNLSIYPNPANDVINISAGDLIINSIKITDINGRIINTIDVALSSTVEINVSDLTSGIYFLTVYTDQGVGTSKIVKK